MFKSRLPNFSLRETQFSNTHKLKSDDHSVSVPPLPIPNRTVKRNRADDSVVRPCESRSSSDYPLKTPVSSQRWAFYFGALPQRTGLPGPPGVDSVLARATSRARRRCNSLRSLAHYEKTRRQASGLGTTAAGLSQCFIA